jgi:hypothetical protein
MFDVTALPRPNWLPPLADVYHPAKVYPGLLGVPGSDTYPPDGTMELTVEPPLTKLPLLALNVTVKLFWVEPKYAVMLMSSFTAPELTDHLEKWNDCWDVDAEGVAVTFWPPMVRVESLALMDAPCGTVKVVADTLPLPLVDMVTV